MAGKKLLVADDSLTIQKVIRLALSNEGYDIQAVDDGNDAVQQISVIRPDAVLIDVSLPQKSAFEVKRAINAQPDLRNVRFVLMSSAFEKVDEAQVAEARFDGRLTKPFDPAHLRQVLQEVLSKTSAAPAPEPLAPTRSARELEFDDFKAALTPPPPLPPLPDTENSLPDFEPIKPIELPEESADPVAIELWDRDLEPPPLPGTFPSSSAPPTSSVDDTRDEIKTLTESTIRMSGLDDFEWSVNEPVKRPLEDFSQDEPALEPHVNLIDDGGSTFSFNSSASAQPSRRRDEVPPLAQPQPPQAPSGAEPVATPVMPISAAQMEEIVTRELRQTLERMAQKILPEVAERVIKQEIHRLLQETP